jgi:uncharacterized membrane protein
VIGATHSQSDKGSGGGAPALRRLRIAAPALANVIDRTRLDYLYLALALAWGLVLVFLMPPFQNTDEVAHYYRAWGVSAGQILARRDATVTVPKNVAELPVVFDYAAVAQAQRHYSAGPISRSLGERLSATKVDVVSSAAGYSALGYVPQAFGIDLVRWTGRSPLGALYAGRLFNLLASVAITFLAIRLLPFGKPLLLLVALFPMTVVQMASLSPDALTIACAFLFTALAVRLSQTARLGPRQLFLLGAGAVVLLNFKPGYVALALLLLLLSPSQLGSKSRYALFVGGSLTAAVLVTWVILRLGPDPQATLLVTAGPASGVSQSAQLHHVLAHPVAFLRTLSSTFGLMSMTYVKTMVGQFAWGGLNPSDAAVVAMGLGLVLCLGRNEPVMLTPRHRLVLAVSFVLTVVSVALGLYLVFTPVGAGIIKGIQGRYLLPVLPLGLLAILGVRLRRRWVLVGLLVVVVLIAVVSTLRALLYYYY